jgi:hypothetical protein
MFFRAFIRSYAFGLLLALGFIATSNNTLTTKDEYIKYAVLLMGNIGIFYYFFWWLASTFRSIVTGWPFSIKQRIRAVQRANTLRGLFGIPRKDTPLFGRASVQAGSVIEASSNIGIGKEKPDRSRQNDEAPGYVGKSFDLTQRKRASSFGRALYIFLGGEKTEGQEPKVLLLAFLLKSTLNLKTLCLLVVGGISLYKFGDIGGVLDLIRRP